MYKYDVPAFAGPPRVPFAFGFPAAPDGSAGAPATTCADGCAEGAGDLDDLGDAENIGSAGKMDGVGDAGD